MPTHDDVIKWKHFPRNWPFVQGIHRSPVNSPHKGQWREALMFSLICVWINGWVNNREAGDLRRNRAHYDVTVMNRETSKVHITVPLWVEPPVASLHKRTVMQKMFPFDDAIMITQQSGIISSRSEKYQQMFTNCLIMECSHYKSCLFYPLWETTSHSRPCWGWSLWRGYHHLWTFQVFKRCV